MTTFNNSRYKLILKYPASWWRNQWREALPSGNGKIGAAVYGGVNLETIVINHEDLWHMGIKDKLPDVSDTLKETRTLIEKKQFNEANGSLTNALKKKNYHTRLASVIPLGDLKVRMSNKEVFQHYRRVLNMETGEIEVSWQEGKQRMSRRLFVSRADDVIVYELQSDEEIDSVDFQVSLHKSDSHKMHDKVEELSKTVKVKADGDFLFYSVTNDDYTDFGAVIRIVPMNGQCVTNTQSINCKQVKKIIVFIKVFVKSDHQLEWSKLQKELLLYRPNYQEHLNLHVPLHQQLFHSASLSLEGNDYTRSNEELLLEAYEGDVSIELIEKMWSFGRYLFISGTRDRGEPFSMYGLWAGDYNLMWSHRMANENIQMMYWHANVGGLTECIPPLFYYYENMLDDFRENASKLFGCRGIYIPAGTTPSIGVPNQIVPVIMNWTGAAGWLAQHFYDYYLYTDDEEFLKDHLLPLMREIACFYEDFLVKEEDGSYTFIPSVSPENTPQNFMPKTSEPIAHPMPTAMNATMDIAIAKELFQHFIEACIRTKLYLEEIEKWETILKGLPSYMLDHEGALKEWSNKEFEDRYDHRHLSHIYPLFPGRELQEESETILFNACKKAVEKRVIGAQTGWSFAHMSCIYARLHEGNKALQHLEYLSRSCLLSNFYTLHNDWRNMGLTMEIETAPVQMDANLGWVNAVQEMLLFVSENLIKVLPARPDKWKRGSVKDFRFYTGRISFSWDVDAGKFEAEIKSVRRTVVTIKLPHFVADFTYLGEEIRISKSKLGAAYIDIKMQANQSLKILNK
ncbi:glycoside hydrolase N-terminal domain-containing protein [Halalkalibacter sp. APA_J-10(15)]|uniref:glycosyl hydrolase family 95 catalytic domain-containing protein n=1 Tax=Halalkalibacter sp. APA_J-10(15) TaxID=2933805 RepID=UPI001FF5699E|nr:glycoside hydrolase N-terminal domain-containing protein [Halalkalibacter sp. APA_J-10(15)]MCK0473678.1 glycoside hydrolase family 95 protein [Halalkalibacter sp. APA_J-10(15)]